MTFALSQHLNETFYVFAVNKVCICFAQGRIYIGLRPTYTPNVYVNPGTADAFIALNKLPLFRPDFSNFLNSACEFCFYFIFYYCMLGLSRLLHSKVPVCFLFRKSCYYFIVIFCPYTLHL